MIISRNYLTLIPIINYNNQLTIKKKKKMSLYPVQFSGRPGHARVYCDPNRTKIMGQTSENLSVIKSNQTRYPKPVYRFSIESASLPPLKTRSFFSSPLFLQCTPRTNQTRVSSIFWMISATLFYLPFKFTFFTVFSSKFMQIISFL